MRIFFLICLVLFNQERPNVLLHVLYKESISVELNSGGGANTEVLKSTSR